MGHSLIAPDIGRNTVKLALILCASAVALILAVNAAPAQTIEQNWQRCQHGKPGDDVIAGCTALINSGQGDARTRSAE
jgi:hypothetical protein